MFSLVPAFCCWRSKWMPFGLHWRAFGAALGLCRALMGSPWRPYGLPWDPSVRPGLPCHGFEGAFGGLRGHSELLRGVPGPFWGSSDGRFWWKRLFFQVWTDQFKVQEGSRPREARAKILVYIYIYVYIIYIYIYT